MTPSCIVSRIQSARHSSLPCGSLISGTRKIVLCMASLNLPLFAEIGWKTSICWRRACRPIRSWTCRCRLLVRYCSLMSCFRITREYHWKYHQRAPDEELSTASEQAMHYAVWIQAESLKALYSRGNVHCIQCVALLWVRQYQKLGRHTAAAAALQVMHMHHRHLHWSLPLSWPDTWQTRPSLIRNFYVPRVVASSANETLLTITNQHLVPRTSDATTTRPAVTTDSMNAKI